MEQEIREFWQKINGLRGPSYHGQETKLRNACSDYASAVIDANDVTRIKTIGRKYLRLASNKELSGDKLRNLVRNVITFEMKLD